MECLNGKILHVDLTREICQTESPETKFFRKYIGGRGIALPYLLQEMPAESDPLSPDNILVYASSIIGGVPGPAIPRLIVCGKSPLTGAFGESEAGGYWAPELKKAGFEAVIIKGKASSPVYLWIKDGEAEIRQASHLWGKVTGKVEEIIKEELDDTQVRVAQIGPGGERLVRFAGIVNELAHFNGRNGLGAVMGAKNLKALAVRGTKEISLADSEKVKEINSWILKTGLKNPLAKNLHEYGTVAAVETFNIQGSLPTENWNKGTFSKAKNLTAQKMNETIGKKPKGCFACPIRCKRVVEVKEDNLSVDPRYGGPEYESVAALGSLLKIDNLKIVAKLNEICNKNTLDTISAGMTIAFALECYEKGIITKKDTGGLKLGFGEEESVLQLLQMIIARKNIGDLLAEGSYRAAKELGISDKGLVFEVKKQEIPMHDPRFKTGLALQFALSSYGADHMKAAHDSFFEEENSPGILTSRALGIANPVPALASNSNKVNLFIKLSLYWTLIDMLGACVFGYVPRGPIPITKLIDLIQAATGTDISLYELMEAAERGINMARIFNIRAGFTEDDDYLPDIFFENLSDGPRKGEGALKKEEFQRMKKTAYEMLGWDSSTGNPRASHLERLGLQWLVEQI